MLHFFQEQGLLYGPTFQAIQEVSYNQDEALAFLKLPEVLKKDFHYYHLHPSLMDAGLQSLIGLIANNNSEKNQISKTLPPTYLLL